MNKADKHIQSGSKAVAGGNLALLLGCSPLLADAGPAAGAAGAPAGGANDSATSPMNVFNSIMSFLPDNRPITSLHIVEDYER